MLQHNVACRLSVGVILFLLSLLPMRGQEKQPLSISIPNQQLNNLIQGRVYYPNYVSIIGSQYLTENWQIGNVKLMGEVYNDLPLWYDIYTDDLILLDWKGTGYGMIKLNREHLESFAFNDRLFINPGYSNYNKYELRDKFHEVIYEGGISFLIVRNIETQRDDNIDHFIRKDSKILIHSGGLFEFKNKKSFLKAIPPDTKDDTAKYIKRNKIHLKNVPDKVWKELVVYVNELIQAKGSNGKDL